MQRFITLGLAAALTTARPALAQPASDDAAFAASGPRAAEPGAAGDIPIDAIPIIDLGAYSVPRSEDISGPQQIGVTVTHGEPFELLDLALEGAWDVTPDDQWRGRVRIRSEGAGGLRLLMDGPAVPGGSILRILDGQGQFIASRPAGHQGPWWTPSIPGAAAIIEFIGSEGGQDLPSITVTDVAVLDAAALGGDPGMDGGGARRSISCTPGSPNLDCHADPTSESQSQRSVVWITFIGDEGGLFSCTGALIRDPFGSEARPYILTAAHCIDSQAEASSAEFLWFYYKRGGQAPCARDLPVSEGSVLAATVPQTDMSLLVLNTAPPAGAYASPIRTDAIGEGERNFTCYHHGGSAPQLIFTRPIAGRGSCRTSDGSWRSPQHYEFSFVQGQSLGTIERGASGAPLFDSQGAVRGTVRGICFPGGSNFDFCANRAQVDHYFGSLAESLRLGLSSGFSTPPDDAFEPNDSVAEARSILATGAAVNLQLIDLDDYFMVSFATPGRLELLLTGSAIQAGARFDPDLFLLDSATRVLARSDSSGAAESIVRDIAAGTYFIRIQRFTGGTFEVGSYRLTPRFTPSATTTDSGTQTTDDTSSPVEQPPPTDPVIDRQVAALDRTFDKLTSSTLLRFDRTVVSIRTRVERLRARGIPEERIVPSIDATVTSITRLRDSIHLRIDRTPPGIIRRIEKLALRDDSIVAAAQHAVSSTIPEMTEAARAAITQGYEAALAQLDELRDNPTGVGITP